MAYHFPLMPRIYMAIAQEDRFPITDIMRQTPEIPANCQWAMFLRNHDELTLEMVTDAERDYLWSTYAVDPRARINLGIRRRLAPLMDNDRRKIELMNSILLSMPGTPIIYYGDEIGMGDNIYLGDRNSVRTPMQWTPDRNGGFSAADPAQLYLPCIMDPVYGYDAVNVEAQTRSLSSLLNWMKRLINVRKSTKVFGRGTLKFIRPANRAVLAYVRQLGDEAILCVANISRSAQAVELDMSAWKGRVPQEMLGRTHFPRIGDLPYLVTLPPYGFFWFSLNVDPKSEPEKILPRDITTLVIGHGWENALSSWTRRTFEAEVLPTFMPERRWFADKDSRSISTKVSVAIPMSMARAASPPWSWTYGSQRCEPLFPAADGPLVPLHRDRQEPGERAGRRPARRQRGHFARCDSRAGFHHSAAEQDPRRRNGRQRRTEDRIQANVGVRGAAVRDQVDQGD